MLRVMIVDDERLSRQYFKSFIHDNRLEVEVVGEASNGTEALAVAAEVQPDAVFLDIRMPLMDGIETAWRLRQDLPGIKIVFLTAYDHFLYAQEAIRLGAYDYLLKPVKPNEMVKLITKLCEIDQGATGTQSIPGKEVFAAEDQLDSSVAEVIVKVEQDMMQEFKAGDLVAFKESFSSYICTLKTQQLQLALVKTVLTEFLIMIIRLCSEAGLKQPVLISPKRHYLAAIRTSRDLESLSSTAQDFIDEMCALMQDASQKRVSRAIFKALDYLEKNFNKNVTLTEVSHVACLSPSYFSKLFKEQVGGTLTEHLNTLRIAQAKQLIRSSDLSMKEIAEIVGFSDQSYFGLVFKCLEGSSPTEYKKTVIAK